MMDQCSNLTKTTLTRK